MKNEEKTEYILQAARAVFFRYGYVRTTMGDIAKEVGMSRPALYILFSGKEEIFSAVITWMNEQAIKEIQSKIDTYPTLQAKLTYAFEVWVVEGYERVKLSPDAQDLFDYSFEAVKNMYLRFGDYIVDLFQQFSSLEREVLGELAQMLLASTHAFKEVATDSTDLRRMLNLLISMTLAWLKV